MGWQSSLLIVILVLAILFSMLYVSMITDQGSYRPKISKREALGVVEGYLKERIDGFIGISLYCCSYGPLVEEPARYIPKDEFLAEGYELIMRHYHKNSTYATILADEDTGNYTSAGKCVSDCLPRLGESTSHDISGHIVYVVDSKIDFEDGSLPAGFLIDSFDGEIYFSNFFCNRDTEDWCKVDTAISR